MAEIKITIPNDKIDEVKAAFAEERVGPDGIPPGYTINTWGKYCVETYIKSVVLRKRRKDAIKNVTLSLNANDVIA